MKIPQELKSLSKRDLIRIIIELEKRLLAYENAHTPPSMRNGNYPKRESTGNPVGAPKGHEGTTRQSPEPTETKTLNLSSCPSCQTKLGKPKRIERRIIEELPDPQPIRVIEFLVHHYFCNHCNKEIIATSPELPKEGNLGNNLQAQIVLMKYEERLPHRKIANVLNRQYGLDLSPATILDVTRRVADHLNPEYERIKHYVLQSTNANADETGAKVNGKRRWLWVFMTADAVMFLLRKKRDHKVIEEVLGRDYRGILTCDGFKAYSMIAKTVQRCWAHLLREAKFLAQKHGRQAMLFYNFLKKLFEKIKTIPEAASLTLRKMLFDECIRELNSWINTCKTYAELKRFVITIENGIESWFTCVLHPGIKPTNNKAERELREFVVQRKIYPTFRSEKGPRITETIMSVLSTWRLRGLNTYKMLRINLSS